MLADQELTDASPTAAESADTFPKSHQILMRDFSNASTIFSETDVSREGSNAALRLKDLEQIMNGKGNEKPISSAAQEIKIQTFGNPLTDEDHQVSFICFIFLKNFSC